MFSQALYYPWIDIRDEGWLKTSLLYWETVRTIVPHSINEPYSTETGRYFYDVGFLVPVRVKSDMQEIEELADDVISFLQTDEGVEFFVMRSNRPNTLIHVEKLPELRRLARIHPDKLPWEIRHHLEHSLYSRRRGEWFEVDSRFADYYMTLLATRLSERIGAELLTPLSSADRLALSVKMDARLSTLLSDAKKRRWWSEYEAMSPRRIVPRSLARGLLAHIAIERISIDPETPVERLLEFRNRHKDELAQFRMKIEHLTATINADLPIEALRQQVSDICENEIVPALIDLKRALNGQRIRWLAEGFLKIAFLSVGSSSLLVTAGLSVPTALWASAGLSLIVSGTLYNVARREALYSNPYSYLLAMSKELGS